MWWRPCCSPDRQGGDVASHVSLPGDVSLIAGTTGLSGAGVSVTHGGVSLKSTGVALGGADVPFPELSFASIPATAAHSSTISATLNWLSASPAGFTAVWEAGDIASTVSAFALLPNQQASATFTTPATPGTYTLKVTGQSPNTFVVTSGNVVIT